MRGKPDTPNALRQLKNKGFMAGYKGDDPAKPGCPFYMEGYMVGKGEAHRQAAEQEAYFLECQFRGVQNMDMEDAVEFSQRFHASYEAQYRNPRTS